MEMNEREVLESAGLSPAEASVYLELLNSGSTTAGPIIHRTGLHRGTAYAILQRLIEKGLASYVIKDGKRFFEAADPNVLLSEMKEREENLKSILPNLVMKKERSKSGQSVTVYEGYKGFRSAFDDVLKTLKRGDEYHIMGISYMSEEADRFFMNFWKRRAKLGIKVKATMNENIRETYGKWREAMPLSEIRYVPKELMTPAVLSVYKNKTIINIVTKKKPLAFVIESDDFSDSIRKYFEMIWNQKVRVSTGIDAVRQLVMETFEYPELKLIGGRGYLTDRMPEIHEMEQREGERRSLKWKNIVDFGTRGHKITTLKFCETRYFSRQFINPNAIWIYGKKVAIVNWSGKEPVVFHMDDEKIHESFSSHFDMLWNQDVKIFRGPEEIAEVFDDIVESMEKGDEMQIMGASELPDRYVKLALDFHRKRAKKGIRTRTIINEKATGIARIFGPIPLTRMRYMPEGMFTPAIFLTCGSRTVISIPKEYTLIVMENENVTKAFRAYFEQMWSSSEFREIPKKSESRIK